MKKLILYALSIVLLTIVFSCARTTTTTQHFSLKGPGEFDSLITDALFIVNENQDTEVETEKRFPGFNPSITDKEKGWTVYSENTHFKLLYHPVDEDWLTSAWYYYIYNSNDEVAEEGGYSFYGKQLFVEQIDNNIIKIRSWTGIGPATRWSRYYSVTRDVFSSCYLDTYDEYCDLVVFPSTHKTVIVRDMFDEQLFYVELSTFSQPLAEFPAPIYDAKFVNDGKSIEVSYFTANKDILRFTEIIDLP